MSQSSPYYITTPIYYVNDYPHIGHAYTTVAADVMARYHRMKGSPVYFLTGTDEHGQKIQKAAEKNNETPIELADRVVQRFEKLWQDLHISHDDFIRTTQDRHQQGAKEVFRRCYDNGDIYAGQYEGWYAVNDEAFLTDTQVKELGEEALKQDPNIIWLKEETFYFRLSAYAQPLLDHIEAHPEFIAPESRRKEVKRFIEGGLKDLSVSRTSFEWGVPVPHEPNHVMYVWMDALSNYISALGFPNKSDLYETFWPANVHLVGKDILRFHTVYWPAFLMSAGLTLPKQVFAHGWWTVEGEKMSKSKGNFVDPFSFTDTYGADAFRYFLLREFPFGQDGNFSNEQFVRRLNTELANELGNLVSRTVSMVTKYFDGVIPDASSQASATFMNEPHVLFGRFQEKLEQMAFDQALQSLWSIIRIANQTIDERAPWTLAKEQKHDELAQVLVDVLEVIRLAGFGITPFMPQKARELFEKMGLDAPTPTQGHDLMQNARALGTLKGATVKKGDPLFARIETPT